MRSESRFTHPIAAPVATLAVILAASAAGAVDVNFDVFPGPDGKFGTGDDILVAAGTEITDQYMGVGVIVENAVSSTALPGLYAIPQGGPGSETSDIVPTTPPFAAATLDIPGDLGASSTGWIRFRFFPSATDFSLDMLDVESSGNPGTKNTYIDVKLTSGAVERLLVPAGPNAGQQTISYFAPGGLEIIDIFVSLNNGVVGGESMAVDSLRFAPANRCWLTSGGWLNAWVNGGRTVRHSFGGNVGPPPAGAWEHQDHGAGLNFHSNNAQIIECTNDGLGGPGHPRATSNTARFRGTGRLNNQPGYAFEARVIDRGEPGRNDQYAIRVWRVSDGKEFIKLDQKLSGGNIQIHPAK